MKVKPNCSGSPGDTFGRSLKDTWGWLGVTDPRLLMRCERSAILRQTLQLHCSQPAAKSKVWGGEIPPKNDELTLSSGDGAAVWLPAVWTWWEQGSGTVLPVFHPRLHSFLHTQQEIQLFFLIFTLQTFSYWAKWTLLNAHRHSGKAHTRSTDQGSISKHTKIETFLLLINPSHWLLFPIFVSTAQSLCKWNDFNK